MKCQNSQISKIKNWTSNKLNKSGFNYPNIDKKL